MKDQIETLMKANILVDKLKKECEELKANLIQSCEEYKHYFECNWDYDPDLLSADQERNHYRWTISKLQELLQYPYPNYIDKINEHENKLPY